MMTTQEVNLPIVRSDASVAVIDDMTIQAPAARLLNDRETDQTLQSIIETPRNIEAITRAFRHEDRSWEDVIETIDTATRDFDLKAGKSKVKDPYRNRVLVMTLYSLTDMIPDQDGLSVMRGGLKFIFKLLQKRTENQQQILRIFADVPVTFGRACEAIRTHPGDTILRSHVNELFTTLVDVTPKLVEILLKRYKASFPSRLFKQHPEHEAAVISDCLDEVTRASRKVTSRIEVLLDQTAAEILEETRVIKSKLEASNRVFEDIYGDIQSIQISQMTIEQSIASGRDKHSEGLQALAAIMDQKLDYATSNLKAELKTVQSLLRHAIQDNGNHTAVIPTYQESPTTYRAPLGQSFMTYSDIFLCLGISDLSFLVSDLEEVLRAGNDISGIARSKWLLVTPRFQSWMCDPARKSDIVLVHGQLDDVTTGKISALSVLAALFASTRKGPGAIVLHHFCGLHSHQDLTRGPRGLLQSLIAQILVYLNQYHRGSAGLSGVSNELLHDAAQRDILASCLLFSQLLAQVERHVTVYCVIDNVSEYETSLGNWDQELRDVVGFLQSLVYETTDAPAFKLLFLATIKSIQITRQIHPSDQIWLSSGNLLSDSVQPDSFAHDLERAVAGW